MGRRKSNMKKARFDVIGVGACAVDYLGIVPEFPEPDTKNRIKKLIRQGGGPVATALVCLSRLGSKTGFLGKLGADELSCFVLDDFVREGVDVRHVIREEGAGPYFAFVIVDEKEGKRTIWWTDENVCPLKSGELKADVIASSRFLLVDEYQLESALLASRIAKEAGTQVVLDAESPGKPHMDNLVRLCDVLIVPDEFACGFTGIKDFESSAQSLLNMGPGTVVITLGDGGAFCKTEDKAFHLTSFQVDVVDTTGCGDVFHGGFIHAMLQDWPPEIATEFASAVSAMNCRALGGRVAAPSMDEVKDFLMKKGSPQMKKLIAVR